MQKRLFSLMLIVITLFSVGCAGSSRPAVQNSDAPSGSQAAEQTEMTDDRHYVLDYHYGSLGSLGTSNSILETDDAVYYLYDELLYFSDKQYKDFMPLCPRPDCHHDDRDCGAYIGETLNGIWIYDKYIYYVDPMRKSETAMVTYPVLRRLRLDGTQHNDVMKLPAPEFDRQPERNQWSVFYMNKYMWVTCISFEKAVSIMPDETYVYRIDLEDMSVNETLSGPGWMLSENGRDMYCLATETTKDSDGFSRVSKYTLTHYDIETGETRSIGDLEMPDGLLLSYMEGVFGVYGNRFVYVFWNDAPARTMLYSMDLSTGESILLGEGDGSEKWPGIFDWTNGYFIRHYKPGVEDSSEWGLYVYDLDLNEADRYLYAGTPDADIDRTIFLQTDSYIFACSGNGMSYASAMPEWYIDKADIGTGNLMWKRWAPEG